MLAPPPERSAGLDVWPFVWMFRVICHVAVHQAYRTCTSDSSPSACWFCFLSDVMRPAALGLFVQPSFSAPRPPSFSPFPLSHPASPFAFLHSLAPRLKFKSGLCDSPPLMWPDSWNLRLLWFSESLILYEHPAW